MSSYTLTNGASGLLHFQAGLGHRYLDGSLINDGTVQVDNDTTFLISGATYTNNAAFNVSSGVTLTITNSGTLTNFSANTLTGGTYDIAGTFRFPGADIVTNRAEIILRGASSQILNDNGSTDALANFVTNDTPGIFRLLDGRSFTASGAFTNNGLMELGGGTFDAPSLDNATGAQIFGYGTIVPRPTNHGHIRAAGGTLVFADGIHGGSGTVTIDPDGTLDLSGGSNSSSADDLIHLGGQLVLGANDFLVENDYQNATFGSGNSFNHRANVTGAGQINADPAVTQMLVGNVTDGNTATATMAFGNVHVGSSTTKNYAVRNNGASGPSIRGAIQTAAGGGNITDSRLNGTGVTASNFGPVGPSTNAPTVSVTFNATSAGALSGQQVHITNNFDNVADQDLVITGAAYRLAGPTAHTPEPVNFGILHVGDPAPSQTLSITNNVPNDGFSEALNASIGSITPTGGVTTNGGSFTGLAPGATNNSSLAVGITTTTAGIKNGTATITLTSDGAGSSGLGLTSLPQQTVNVIGQVNHYAVADMLKVAGSGTFTMTGANTFSLNFGTVVEGHTDPLAELGVQNDALGFPSDTLSGSFTLAAPAFNLTGFSAFSGVTAGSTHGGLMVSLDTATPGTFSGSITLSPQSVNPNPFSQNLPSITVNLSGRIQLAGDFNGDDIVDAADYVIMKKQFDTPAAYAIWSQNFGRTVTGSGGSPGAGGNSAVPEPSAVALALLGLMTSAVLRRR
jgi:hypothetical protein